MQKAMPQFYQGEEVVQLSLLPPDQATFLRNYLPDSSYRKLIVGNEILEDCVAYEEYEYWMNYCSPVTEPVGDF